MEVLVYRLFFFKVIVHQKAIQHVARLTTFVRNFVVSASIKRFFGNHFKY